MNLRPHLRIILVVAATVVLGVVMRWVHAWYAEPFAVWVGWDEAYIAAFAERMLERSWMPYVDAVSHRGPLLYWIAALVELIGGRFSWLPFRNAALFFSEASLVLLLAIGIASRRPLGGFIAACTFVFATLFGMEPKDGIGFNGEIVALPFVLAATWLTIVAHKRYTASSDRRVWLAAATGALVVLGGLCKQIAFGHIVPIALWWLAVAIRERNRGGPSSLRWIVGLLAGTAAPMLAVIAFFARAGHLRPFFYYFYTYNKAVYLGPVTLGFALESSYLFLRDHVPLLLMTLLGIVAAFSRPLTRARLSSPRSWLAAYADDPLLPTSALQLLVGLAGAVSTFRFWEHYFITAVPWLGLVAGLLLEDRLSPPSESSLPPRPLSSSFAVVVPFTSLAVAFGFVTRLWLDGQRRAGAFGDPSDEPITNYIVQHTRPDESLFVWGFAPEFYTSAHRRPASRFVFTTFVGGIVPWFYSLTPQQEQHLVVPGSHEQLLSDLQSSPVGMVLDVPTSIGGRSLRAYPDLAGFLDRHFCFDRTMAGRNDRIVHIYLPKRDDAPCEHAPPPP